jgi:hypothetical protein
VREYDVFIPRRVTEVDMWVSNLLRQMGLQFNTDMIIRFENTADIASGIYISGNNVMIIGTDSASTKKDIYEQAVSGMNIDFSCHTSGDIEIGGDIDLVITTEPISLYNGELISLEDCVIHITTDTLELSDGKTIGGEHTMIISTDQIQDTSSVKYLNIDDIMKLATTADISSTKDIAINGISLVIATDIQETVRRLRLLGDIQTDDTLSTYGDMALSDFYYISE